MASSSVCFPSDWFWTAACPTNSNSCLTPTQLLFSEQAPTWLNICATQEGFSFTTELSIVRVSVTLLLSVCLGVGHLSHRFGASPVKTERVCSLHLLLTLVSKVILRSMSCGTHDHIFQNCRPGPCIYIPQEQGGPVVPPNNGFPFRCLLWLARPWRRYSDPPPH
jgi:hypothetical protein